MAPISLKRSTPSYSDDGTIDEPESKKRRLEYLLPRTPPPEEGIVILPEKKMSMFDEDPRALLLRSVALVLEHVGFEGASKTTLEALCDEVDTYAAHFLSKVTSSMLNARRSQPTPLDFKFALSEFDLPIASIEPHIHPPIPSSKTQVRLDEMPVGEELSIPLLDSLLGNDLSGEVDKNQKSYIPKRFPSFPSKHTYKWTEKESARETDPRKIREEAAKAARQGEEALRRLTKVGKLGKEKDVKNAASKDPTSKERHDMWEMAMEELMVGKRDVFQGMSSGQEDDRSMIVNAERPFFRQGAFAKRKPV